MNPALKCVPSVVFSLLLPALYLYMIFHWRAVKKAHRPSVGNNMISALQMETGGTDGCVISPERRSKFETAKNSTQALEPILPLAPSKAPMIIIIYPYRDYFLNTQLAHFIKLYWGLD